MTVEVANTIGAVLFLSVNSFTLRAGRHSPPAGATFV